MDETDVDSYFYHNNFDISQSQHRIVRVSRGSSKKTFAINLFQLCDLKTQLRYILEEEVNISKRELICLVHSLGDFLKKFDQGSKCIQIPLPKPKVEIGSTKSKDNLFARFHNVIIEHPNRQIRLSFPFGNNKSCVFSMKNFEQHGNQFILTEIVNFNHRENHHLYKNQYYDANRCEIIESSEQLRCGAHSPPACGESNITIQFIGTFFVQIQSVQVNFACTKRLFSLSAKAIINVHNVSLCARCAIFLLNIKQIPFSCRLAKGLTFLKRVQSHFKMLLEMCFVLASIVSTERNAIILTFCNNSEIH